MTTTQRQPPRFYGVTTYQDHLGRFSIRYPTTWEKLDLEGRDGARFVPNPADPETNFTIWVSGLDTKVIAEDLEVLREGVQDGLDALDDVVLESENDVVLGNLLKFEREYAFRDQGSTRKRKQWLLYVDTWLMVLTWQGSDPDEYDYWLAMANYSFATFHLPEALWFFTDRDLYLAGVNTVAPNDSLLPAQPPIVDKP